MSPWYPLVLLTVLAAGALWAYATEVKRHTTTRERLISTIDANAATMVQLIRSLAAPRVATNGQPKPAPAVRRVMTDVETHAADLAQKDLETKAAHLVEVAQRHGYELDEETAQQLVREGVDWYRSGEPT